MLQTDEQIIQQVKGAKRILLTCPQNPHADSLASCLALFLALKKMGIVAEVVITCSEQHLKPLAFLPGFSSVIRDTSGLKHLIIKVAGPGATVSDFRYEVEGDTLTIYITSSGAPLTPEHVRSTVGQPTHDLIITCDAPDLSALGNLYREQAEFFFRTPIINIDHSPANEQYGQINLVDITAVSTSEVIFRLLQAFGEDPLDADIATALLTGMISKTQSFKTPSVTPRSLMIAAELVQHGARRDEIISHLYRQHDLPTLRLWGRVLARLQHDESRRFVWSAVKREDFEKSGTDESRLPGLIDELITTSPGAKIVALLYERADGKIGVWLKTEHHTSALALAKAWNPEGTKTLVNFTLPTQSLSEAEQLVRPIIPQVFDTT